jgi:hypothetical protein
MASKQSSSSIFIHVKTSMGENHMLIYLYNVLVPRTFFQIRYKISRKVNIKDVNT